MPESLGATYNRDRLYNWHRIVAEWHAVREFLNHYYVWCWCARAAMVKLLLYLLVYSPTARKSPVTGKVAKGGNARDLCTKFLSPSSTSIITATVNGSLKEEFRRLTVYIYIAAWSAKWIGEESLKWLWLWFYPTPTYKWISFTRYRFVYVSVFGLVFNFLITCAARWQYLHFLVGSTRETRITRLQ